jgi:hypothetical protein
VYNPHRLTLDTGYHAGEHDIGPMDYASDSTITMDDAEADFWYHLDE